MDPEEKTFELKSTNVSSSDVLFTDTENTLTNADKRLHLLFSWKGGLVIHTFGSNLEVWRRN